MKLMACLQAASIGVLLKVAQTCMRALQTNLGVHDDIARFGIDCVGSVGCTCWGLAWALGFLRSSDPSKQFQYLACKSHAHPVRRKLAVQQRQCIHASLIPRLDDCLS